MKTILQQKTHQIDFRISKSLVDCFAALTGDVNPLHTNKAFGRRSNYRENIVHGMLPVAFIAALPAFCGEKGRVSLKKISGRFLKPAFVGGGLTLKANVIEQDPNPNPLEFEYSLSNAESKTILTTGYFTLSYEAASPMKPLNQSESGNKASRCIVSDPLEEGDLKFEEIKKGDQGKFKFQIKKDHALTFFEMLSEGLVLPRRLSFSKWLAHGNPENLLTSLLISTFVGMCIPGKHATFIDFQVTLQKPIEWNKDYSFNGKVRFTSPSTRTIVENISINPEGNSSDTGVSGKLTVNVNKPTIKMPSIDSLKDQALDLQLRDKVVLITGASRGIGETSAKLFSLHGAKVAVNYLSGKEDADRIVDEIIGNGGRAFAIQADVSDQSQVREMVDRVQDKYGTIHILVNNAVSNFTSGDFLGLTWDEIQNDIDVMIKGAFHCCQAVLPLMMNNNGGKIINISTVATEVPPPKHAKYVIAKSGLVGLTRSLAVEFAPYNIQVNLVVPSIVETDLSRNVSEMFLERMRNETPMQRNATPVDVARAVVTLASSLASFTTGQKIMVTGGNAPFL